MTSDGRGASSATRGSRRLRSGAARRTASQRVSVPRQADDYTDDAAAARRGSER